MKNGLRSHNRERGEKPGELNAASHCALKKKRMREREVVQEREASWKHGCLQQISSCLLAKSFDIYLYGCVSKKHSKLFCCYKPMK